MKICYPEEKFGGTSMSKACWIFYGYVVYSEDFLATYLDISNATFQILHIFYGIRSDLREDNNSLMQCIDLKPQ